MKNKVEKLYSLVLGFLIVASIVQTGRLWYDHRSDYNPFSRSTNNYTRNVQAGDETTTESYLSNPKNLVVYKSNKNPSFALIGSTKNVYEKLFNKSYSILKTISNKGTINGTQDLDYSMFWDKVDGSIILSYNYMITDKILKEELGIESNINLKSIGDANLIVLEIQSTGNRHAEIYFANTETKKMIEVSYFVAEHQEDYENLYMINNETTKEKMTLFKYLDDKPEIDYAYISSLRSGKNIFANNIFLRDKNASFHTMGEVNLINPFIQDGMIVEDETFKAFARGFFRNPNSMETTVGSGKKYYFYTANTVQLKYQNNGILEYKQTVYDDVTVSEKDSYVSALSFLEHIDWHELFSLKGYKKDDEGRYHFYFGYNLNNFPVQVNLEDMEHPIEIIVKSGKVQEAKIYLLSRQSSNQPDFVEFKDDYVNALGRAYQHNTIQGEKVVEDVSYGYVKDPDRDDMYTMQWVMKVNGKEYYEPVKEGGQ